MKFLISLLFLFSFVSCMSSNSNRNPAGIPPGLNGNIDSLNIFTNASFEQVGPNGTVYFYYLTPEADSNSWAPDHELQLNIVKCSKNSVIEKKSDCVKEPGSKVIVVPYLAALASMKSYLKAYLNVKDTEVSREVKYTRLREFISVHGESAADPLEVEQMETDEMALEVVNGAVLGFDLRLKSRGIETVYHNRGGETYSLILDMFRSFVTVVSDPKDELLTPIESEVIRVEGRTTFKYVPKWAEGWKNREYTLDVEGQSYLSPKGVSLIESMSKLGFGTFECHKVTSKNSGYINGLYGSDYSGDVYEFFKRLCKGKDYFAEIHINLVDFRFSYATDRELNPELVKILFPDKDLVEVKSIPQGIREKYDEEFENYTTSIHRITNGRQPRPIHHYTKVYKLIDKD